MLKLKEKMLSFSWKTEKKKQKKNFFFFCFFFLFSPQISSPFMKVPIIPPTFMSVPAPTNPAHMAASDSEQNSAVPSFKQMILVMILVKILMLYLHYGANLKILLLLS